jgi:hypothetical protein
VRPQRKRSAKPSERNKVRNWIRNSHFHNRSFGDQLVTSNGVGRMIAPQWWHGPGASGATSVSFQEAVTGQWEGNPERFLRIEWLACAQAGDAVFAPDFRFTFLEQWINSARILGGKEITFSGQLRSPGGCVVRPLIWRTFNEPTFEIWKDGPIVSVGPTVTRFDFTMTLPPVPQGKSVPLNSYVGVGLDMGGQYGPTLDIGPMRLNEGGLEAFDEVPHYEEVFLSNLA